MPDNWFKRLKADFLKMANEYWIDDNGSAIFADGDLGDFNHEGYVMETLLSQYGFSYEGNGIDISDRNFIPEWIDANFDEAKAYIQKKGYWKPEFDQIEDHQQLIDIMTQYIPNTAIFEMAGATPEQAQIMNGAGVIDARDYAMEHMGWKRVYGNNVETWEATPEDLKTIASGMFDIGQNDDENQEINIYVGSQGKWYTDVPISALENGSLFPLPAMKNNLPTTNLINYDEQQKKFYPNKEYDGD